MAQIVAKGIISNLLKKFSDAFFKGFENMFKESNVEITHRKGELVKKFSSEYNEVLDESGNPVDENSAIAEFNIILYYPEDESISKSDAEEFLDDIEKWNIIENTDLEMTFQNKNRIVKKHISTESVNKEIGKYMEKFNLPNAATYMKFFITLIYEENNGTTASKKMNISLVKIAGSNEIDINLKKLNANYDLSEALNDVSSIVYEDDFIQQLPDNQEVFYEVISEDDDLDVNECDDFSCMDTIDYMVNYTTRLLLQLVYLKMVVRTTDSEHVYEICIKIIYLLMEIYDYLADELFTTDPNYQPNIDINIETYSINSENILSKITDELFTYTDCLMDFVDYCDIAHVDEIENCINKIEEILS